MELVETQPASRRWIYVINVLLVVGCCLTWFWAVQRSRKADNELDSRGPRLGAMLSKKGTQIEFYKRDDAGVDQLMYPALQKSAKVDSVAVAESTAAYFFTKVMHAAVKTTEHTGWVPFGKAVVTTPDEPLRTVLIYTKPSGNAGYQIGDEWYEFLGY